MIDDMPETRYASSGDVHVAFQITGGGPSDLVWAPGTASHLDLDWEIPLKARFIERLGSFCRLLRFDKRGTGLSDRVAGAPPLEERMDDIRAVMDAAASERAFVFGVSEGANMACLFAATYPERTSGLIIWGGQARWVQTDDYPWGMTPEENDAMIEEVSRNGVTMSYLTGGGAGIPGADAQMLKMMLRYLRAGASPAALAALERMNTDLDVRDVLPAIRVPTLVMNGEDDTVADIEAARDMASMIPGARFASFPGGHTMYLRQDVSEAVAAAMEEFVTGAPARSPTDRVLATVLFTDIVGSTEHLARLGDVAWRAVLAAHDRVLREALERHRGREVNTAGDGFFATFDGPGRAVQCARDVTRAVRPLGIEIRAGVHAGECEVSGDDVGGIAVHIGARVMSLARPSEVLVSRTVRDLTAGSGLLFEDAGEHELRGVPDRWRLYRLVDG